MSRWPPESTFSPRSWRAQTETLHLPELEAGASDEASQARIQRLLSGAQTALRHALALRQMQALHRIALHQSHFNPNQPRVPAGNPDGGQWTAAGEGRGTRLAAADKPRRRGFSLPLLLEVAKRVIEAYRSEQGLWDLLGKKDGTVTWTRFDGTDIFGSNSESPTYTRMDRAAAFECAPD
jgi:hypothetical protein